MKPRFALARLIAGHVFLHACMAGMRMAAPLWALRAGYSPAAVGVLLALFAVATVFLALPAGRFADRHGLLKPVGIAICIASAGAALAVVWPVFPVLCLSALLTGGSTGAAAIALQRHVGRAAANATELKKVFSWLAIGPAISNFIGPFAAGLLIDHGGVWFALLGGGAGGFGQTLAMDPALGVNGFRAAFLFMALLPLCAWFWIRRTPELAPVVRPVDAQKSGALDLLKEPAMRRLLLINWMMSSCWDVHTFVVPVLGHERGFSASAIGTILGAFAVAAALVRVVIPMLAVHLREWAVVTGAMLCTAALFGIYPLLQTALAMAACSVTLGLVLGCVQPMIMSTLHQITPEHRHGEALGLRSMAINGSSVIMPLLFGTAGAAIGVSAVFWAVGGVVGAGSRVAWFLRPPLTPPVPPL